MHSVTETQVTRHERIQAERLGLGLPVAVSDVIAEMCSRWKEDEPDSEYRWLWRMDENEDGTWNVNIGSRSCDREWCRECNIVHIDVDAPTLERAVFGAALLATEHKALLGDVPARLSGLVVGIKGAPETSTPDVA